MKRILIVILIAVSLLAACAVVPGGPRGHRSDGVMIVAPMLPSVVILDVDPFYFHSNFHYHYAKKGWYYSNSRRGPWIKLPRNRYPKEVRYRGKGGKHYRDRDEYQRHRYRDNDYQRGRDRDRDYQRDRDRDDDRQR